MNFDTLKKTVVSLATTSAVLLAVAAASGTSALAQDWRWRAGQDRRVEVRQENDGYNLGFNKGRQDALDRRAFNPAGNRFFLDGNGEFREGFRRGYADGYRQVQSRWQNNGWQNNGWQNNGWERQQENNGYHDGFNRGREDADDHRRFDPNNSEHYRKGNNEYREGFRRGYADGFRQYQSTRRW